MADLLKYYRRVAPRRPRRMGKPRRFLGDLAAGGRNQQRKKDGAAMRAVVTRVREASVTAEGMQTGSIEQGLLVLLGVGPEDTPQSAEKLADKVCGLRIFEDDAGKMNWNLERAGGSLLVVSQFTLYADTKSRRPGFSRAAPPELANSLYEAFMAACRKRGFSVQSGVFGAAMAVHSVNDGPVTLFLDTEG